MISSTANVLLNKITAYFSLFLALVILTPLSYGATSITQFGITWEFDNPDQTPRLCKW